MRKVQDMQARKRAKCAVCGGEYMYYAAWPFGDVCCSDCYFADERMRPDYTTAGTGREYLPTKAPIIDIGGNEDE